MRGSVVMYMDDRCGEEWGRFGEVIGQVARWLLVGTGALAWCACRSAPPEGRFRCSGDGECPAGMRCIAQLCFRSAANAPDGGFAAISNPCGEATDRPRRTVSSTITTPTTWTCDTVHELRGEVRVVDTTLTVEAGSLIHGFTGGVLNIASGARLLAEGRPDAPVVFSSPVDEPGGWRGINLFGAAPIHAPVPTAIVGYDLKYGGTDTDYSCGRMAYVRIEFAGESLPGGGRTDAMSLNGCGSDTRVSFVQVVESGGDGFGVNGGTVGLDHLVVTYPKDDGIDYGKGWTGRAQFVVVAIQDEGNPLASGGPNAIEGDNAGPAGDAPPRSSPVFYNATLLGTSAAEAAASAIFLQKGAHLQLRNAVIAGFGGYAFEADTDSRRGIPAELFIDNTILYEVGHRVGGATTAVANRDVFGPSIIHTDPEIRGRTGTVDAEPRASDAPSNTGGVTPPSPPFDGRAKFRGAVAFGQDWTDGWTIR